MPYQDEREPILPLHLCQVLEEEYTATQRMPARALGWDIQPDQIRLEWLRTILETASRPEADDDPALAFSRHVVALIARQRRMTTAAFAGLDSQALLTALNEVLDSPALYDEHAAHGVTLRGEMLEYVRVHRGGHGVALAGDDLRRFNRLLLEDAYPDAIAPIYRLRTTAIVAKLHAAPRAALCLSGGGIRSGTFALGILQGLAERKLLPRFHYLSTVSGGGYIGSWLSAWIHRHPRGLDGVIDELTRPAAATIEPEPEPLRYLREYSNFVAPRPGLVSADIWSFAAIYLRNLLINWAALIPLLLSALLLPRLVVALLYLPSGGAVPWWVMALLLAGGLGLSVLSVFYTTLNRPSRADALAPGSWWRRRRTQGAFLRYCLLPTVSAGLCLSVFWFWHRLGVSLAPPADAPASVRMISDAVAGVVAWRHPLGFLILLNAIGIGIYLTALAAAMLTVRRTPQLSDLIAAFFTGGSGGLLTWILLVSVFAGPASQRTVLTPGGALYACFAVPAYCLVFFWAAAVFVAVTSKRRGDDWVRETQWTRRFAIDDEDREWLGRHGAWLMITAAAWLVASGLVVFGPGLLLASPKLLAACGGVSGVIAILGGKSALTAANDEKRTPGWAKLVVEHGLAAVAAVFLAILAAAFSLLTAVALGAMLPVAPPDLAHGGLIAILYASPAWLVAGLVVATAAAGFVASLLINLNKFSLHAAYRARIIRAFLGASRTAAERIPNPFTGFDPQDNVQVHELWPGLLREASFRPRGLTRFVVKLRTGADTLSKELFGQLSRSTQALVKNHADANPPSQSLKRALLEDVNRLLDGDPGLIGVPGFSATRISNDARGLLDGLLASSPDPTLVEAVRRASTPADLRDALKERRGLILALNRATLDAAYPDEIEALRTAPPPYRLLHVIGTALNLVGGKRLAWQQRRAESFTISPLHCGSLYRGYRRSRTYGGADGISLGTAVTISGAAVSSNMGYHTSSAVVTLVLTLFNARLGWWLGNPGAAGSDRQYTRERAAPPYRRSFPRVSLAPLLMEAFGLTDDTSRYVLLSDGGHFENLGLYEMVLRRCRFVVVVDGSQDANADFSDLGAAIRKIRIDLGIDITFEPPFEIRAKKDSAARDGKYCAIGTIHYAGADRCAEDHNGVLLYIKPAILGRDEPRDVLQYSAANTAFPHQSTVDQLFDESQFESYRRLGAHVVDTLSATAASCQDFVDQVYTRHLPNAPSAVKVAILRRLEGL
jgi:hypothetical protein